ncbi:Uncharacterized protein Fot_19297 [Forsythia ovata]|uniref:Uncharacterized protein n=1 Tax=Forsythia ovata TaxID=205694 RepID=A0ABD1VKZ9_9LAMI
MLKSHQRERRRISTEGSDNTHEVNGLLRFETLEKVSKFGLELLTLLRKLQELMILRLGGSRAKKAKVNFHEVAPVSALKHAGKVNPREGLPKESSNYVQPSVSIVALDGGA